MTIGQGTETSRRPRWLKTGLFALALCLSGVAAAAVFSALGQPLTGIDDANIFLTYARNLARGDGLWGRVVCGGGIWVGAGLVP